MAPGPELRVSLRSGASSSTLGAAARGSGVTMRVALVAHDRVEQAAVPLTSRAAHVDARPRRPPQRARAALVARSEPRPGEPPRSPRAGTVRQVPVGAWVRVRVVSQAALPQHRNRSVPTRPDAASASQRYPVDGVVDLPGFVARGDLPNGEGHAHAPPDLPTGGWPRARGKGTHPNCRRRQGQSSGDAPRVRPCIQTRSVLVAGTAPRSLQAADRHDVVLLRTPPDDTVVVFRHVQGAAVGRTSRPSLT